MNFASVSFSGVNGLERILYTRYGYHVAFNVIQSSEDLGAWVGGLTMMWAANATQTSREQCPHITDAKFTEVLRFVLLEYACAFLKVPIRVLHLWAIVCPSNPCFIPNLSVAMKGTKLGAGSYNWASVEKLLLDLILISIKKMRTAMKAQLKSNPKNWG
jgi:hypothetical protein